MNISNRQGSQHWLQIAVNRAPNVLLDVLRPALELDSNATIEWRSPLAADDFREYRDMTALRELGIETLPMRPLADFWPQRGPVWDALGKSSDGQLIFLEAKAHIAEMDSPASKASPDSLARIQKSLQEARQFFAPGSTADWSQNFYQYANRLAHHYLFRHENELPSHMIFLYFLNATDMSGPKSEAEWLTAIATLHSALGLSQIDRIGVHEVFMDVSPLKALICRETSL
ncbi:hypothetical protein B1R32_11517 [Abditibacterium utsteinense]|uniref:Uncharacterized protein n=1 Tax=Abditibacterium utsteinense TaxID=1960156 RepID=A0A2S8SQM9_9BACT|nr:hypothetical protein [Abditibacterium utsteinense]PQV63111.1 hypothetical protein B1R32_11517 [Abditibacterium utsteinense]